MSLRTQLYGLILLIATLAFTSSLWSNVKSTRDYLNAQMQSHAQDTATSLGLSISPYMDGKNNVLVETMITAIFDSGYYESIVLMDMNDKVIVSRGEPLIIEGVPSWFIRYFPLNAPVESSDINNGWQIAGHLLVKSHPGVSHAKLWQFTVNNLYSLLMLCGLALFIAYFILKAVLEPLTKLENQAKAVGQKQFPRIKDLPSTIELKTVTQAMNTMVDNIQVSFHQVSQHAEKLSNDAYVDHLTQLGNRRAFESHFTVVSEEMNSNDMATLGLIQLPSLESMNKELGYQKGDNYVLQATALILEQLSQSTDSKLYRLAGSNFVFMVQDSGEAVLEFCERLKVQFSKLKSGYYHKGYAEIVACSYNKNQSLNTILSRLDTLMTQELSTGRRGIVYSHSDTNDVHGLHEWGKLIDALVKTNQVNFTFQPIQSAETENGETTMLYYELFSEFAFNLSNNQLFAMAERLNKSQELDKMVLTKLASIDNFAQGVTIAINLTHQSIHSLDFLIWLKAFYGENKENLPPLVFEINESAILTSVESSVNFIKWVKMHGIQVCIDRFGSSFTSFKYLQGLNVDYLKIDGSYIRDLGQHPENNHFIQAVSQIGHGIGIKVLATFVETAESMKLLDELQFDGFQGNFIQQTVKLTEETENKLCVYSPIRVI